MRRCAAAIGLAAALGLAALAAAPAHAQFSRPQDAVSYRQSAMTLMEAHFDRLVAVVRGAAPDDPAQVRQNAHVLQMLASLPWPAYGPGMQGGNSKPAIWSNPADFKQKHEALQANIAALSAAADTGDIAKLRAAVGAVAASCKACHDVYQK